MTTVVWVNWELVYALKVYSQGTIQYKEKPCLALSLQSTGRPRKN